MKLAYIVSRFPSSSETFIARELNHVAAHEGVEVGVHALFPPLETLVHPSARPWVDRVRRPAMGEVIRDAAWWLKRRPMALLALLLITARDCAREPAYAARSLATLAVATSIARQVREEGVNHVHAHYATFPALAAWACRRLTGVSYSLTVHAHDIFVTQAMLRRKVADAAFVDAISEYNRAFLDRFGGERTDVEVIHCGIEVDRYPYRPRSAPKDGSIDALCVASLQEHKGQRYLLEALARESAPLRRVRLTLIGDGPERDELERLALDLGIDSRVTMTGALDEESVRVRLGACHMFVLPSVVAKDGQMEGLPVALMEALACGIPAVASNLSGIPEIIRDGETGFLAEPGDPESLASALERTIDGACDPAAGRKLVEREFDVSVSAARLVGLFREACGIRSRA